jgi:hypothetical protein
VGVRDIEVSGGGTNKTLHTITVSMLHGYGGIVSYLEL